jgi:hypothetical protein
MIPRLPSGARRQKASAQLQVSNLSVFPCEKAGKPGVPCGASGACATLEVVLSLTV